MRRIKNYKCKLLERRSIATGQRYFVPDDQVTPGIVKDYEDWGFSPNWAYFIAWCIKHRDEIEEKLRNGNE